MNIRKIALFGLALLAGLSYIFYVELPREETKVQAEKLFGSLPREKIAKISVTREDNTFELKNLQFASVGSRMAVTEVKPAEGISDEGSSWQYGEVEGSALESSALTSVTAALAELKVGDPLPTGDVEGDLSVYGLDKPVLEVGVEGTDFDGEAVSTRLLFGKTNDFVKQRYVQVRKGGEEQGNIFLIPEALFSAANRPGNDFRRKSFISFVDHDVQTIELLNGASKVLIERNAEAAGSSARRRSPWEIKESELAAPVRASEEDIAQIFRELRNARATQYFDGEQVKDFEALGLDEQSSHVRLVLAKKTSAGTNHAEKKGEPTQAEGERDEESILIRIHSLSAPDSSGRGPGAYVSVSGLASVIYMDQDLGAKVFKTGAELRDRAVLKLPTDNISRLEIQRLDGEKVALSKSAAGLWTVVPDEADAAEKAEEAKKENDAIADAVFVDELLGKLTALRASDFSKDSRDFGLVPPRASVKAFINLPKSETHEAKSSVVTLLIGAKISDSAESDLYVGVVEGEETVPSEVFTLPLSDIEKILPRREVLVPVSNEAATNEAPASPPDAALVGEGQQQASDALSMGVPE